MSNLERKTGWMFLQLKNRYCESLTSSCKRMFFSKKTKVSYTNGIKIALRTAVTSDWQTLQELNNQVFQNDKDNDLDMDLSWRYA